MNNFQKLPGNPPQHKVVGKLSDGTKIRVGAIEMVWNDYLFIDAVKGSGTYEAGADANNRKALTLARALYLRTSQCPSCLWNSPLPGFSGICPQCRVSTWAQIEEIRYRDIRAALRQDYQEIQKENQL